MTPQIEWSGWSSVWWWQLFWLAATVTSMALIILLNRYERQLVSATVGYWLLGLRLSVVVCVWLTIQQPVLTWTRAESQTGRIVIALDVSESMATQDTHASPAEKFRWARALGLIGGTVTPEQVAAWQQAYERGEPPEWVAPQETADPARKARLGELRRTVVEQALQEVGELSRREIAWRALSQGLHPVLKDLEQLGPVQLLVFGGKAQTMSSTEFAQATTAPPVSTQPQLTALNDPLTQALNVMDGVPARGVIVLSDGRDTAGLDPLGSASRLGQLPAPVFCVPFGSLLRPKDLAIAYLEAPQTVFKDDRPVLKASLATSGFEGQAITLQLSRTDGPSIEQTITPSGPTTQVEFPLELPGLGRHEFTLTLPQLPGESRPDNNAQSIAVTVVDDKVHILVLEGEARWEFRYLDNALQRDERVDLSVVVFDQPYLGVLNQTFFPRSIAWPANGQLEASPLANIDLVILGDVQAAALPPQAWELLEKFVSEAGGTLVIQAGKRHMPLGHQHASLQRLLPVTQVAPWSVMGAEGLGSPTERGFRLRLTSDGANEPMFQFDLDPLRNRAVWGALPGHFWGLIGQAKPGATVYASAWLPGVAETLEAERSYGACVQQYYGQGQVLWLGIDSTWRWRHLIGDSYHHRFWGQLGRWAANTKATAGNSFVKFGPERTEVNLGDEVTLRARWTSEFLKRFPAVQGRVEISRLDGDRGAIPVSTVELKPAADRPQIHEVRAGVLPAGTYRLKLLSPNAELGQQPVIAPLYVRQPPSAELTDLSAQPELLRQIAQAGQGQVIRPDELARLPELLQPHEQTQQLREEIPLWSHWSLVLVFFTLLMTEWVTRKLNGLP